MCVSRVVQVVMLHFMIYYSSYFFLSKNTTPPSSRKMTTPRNTMRRALAKLRQLKIPVFKLSQNYDSLKFQILASCNIATNKCRATFSSCNLDRINVV